MTEGAPTPSAEQQQQVQLVIDERDLKTSFSNAYRIHTTVEEVVLDFCFNMANPNPQGGQAQMILKVTDRVILSYSNVKRLAGGLSQLVRRYEQQFGEIPTGGPQQQAAPGAAARAAAGAVI